MKFKELKTLGKEELDGKLNELKKELIKLNAQVATGTAVKSPGQIKQAKKGIARILTIMNLKQEPKPVKTQDEQSSSGRKSSKKALSEPTEVEKKA